ncbi:hypothetical protein ASPZODRAFT_153807 [Penicilliopsis zonata CBS 506.65]|uniref:DNA-directed RNA polymerase III subunit RPC9 n=1 Tax=Penicilliopsis zonata CBS 506.65 TaxID=1073090 RepID=A0A1L9SB48_9EURO|nr:hypothetical protein ASPZODRAFT_153807 [Penicilliopsis zonata CBS 506.65]OJJ44347.1 hypothetical protein ASPZODRAFT_153807 [Penicilliopsis zonata CBS 506.65]
MRIIDPQTAVLTNVEVLAYLTANPPRRPPNPPPGSRHWVPSPDLRDHNTVVKEIHNYIARLAPHTLKYPRYVHDSDLAHAKQQQQQQADQEKSIAVSPSIPSTEPTPLDTALRDLVTRLQPFGLTKGEVLTIVNLGIGLEESEDENGEEHGAGDRNEDGHVNGIEAGVDGEDVEMEEGNGEEEDNIELAEEDYGAVALLDTVIEEREERLNDEDVARILRVIRQTLGRRVK